MIAQQVDIVVVGASVAAEAFTTRLHEIGFDGTILVVDRDTRMPYERPPLSKAFLTRPEDTELAVGWHETVSIVPAEAVGVDAESKTVSLIELGSGKEFLVGYQTLVIATGASPLRLPIEPAGVLRLRTVADSEAIRGAAAPGTRVGIIGAGAIGAELATSLTENGAEVVLLDKADRPLERLLAGHLGADVTSWLQSIGVDCRWGVDLERVSGSPGTWQLHCGDGSEIACDVLVSAVGVAPVTDWLEGSGLLTEGSLICSDEGRVIADGAEHPDIFAIGDVATHRDADGHLYRTESWTAAADSGARLAERIGGQPVSPAEPPYFWTDVAGRKVQVLGTPSRDGVISVEFENPDRGAVLYKVTAEDGTEGWIGVNAQPKIAMLRMGANV